MIIHIIFLDTETAMQVLMTVYGGKLVWERILFHTFKASTQKLIYFIGEDILLNLSDLKVWFCFIDSNQIFWNKEQVAHKITVHSI